MEDKRRRDFKNVLTGRKLTVTTKTRDDFTEEDIIDRNEKIFGAFVFFLREQNLLI